MDLLCNVTSYRIGQLVGGDEGARLIREATAFLSARAVKSPERFVAHYAPGFHQA
jgi:hypothetical protein